jgi:hypothetical protein
MSSFAHEVFSARTINGPSVKILNIQLIIQQFVAESDHGLRYDLNPKWEHSTLCDFMEEEDNL